MSETQTLFQPEGPEPTKVKAMPLKAAFAVALLAAIAVGFILPAGHPHAAQAKPQSQIVQIELKPH